MQAHAHAAGLGDVRRQGGKDEIRAQHMADQFIHQPVLNQVPEASALVGQHPQPLVDAAVGGGEGVGFEVPGFVHDGLIRAAVPVVEAPLGLPLRLLHQALPRGRERFAG